MVINKHSDPGAFKAFLNENKTHRNQKREMDQTGSSSVTMDIFSSALEKMKSQKEKAMLKRESKAVSEEKNENESIPEEKGPAKEASDDSKERYQSDDDTEKEDETPRDGGVEKVEESEKEAKREKEEEEKEEKEEKEEEGEKLTIAHPPAVKSKEPKLINPRKIKFSAEVDAAPKSDDSKERRSKENKINYNVRSFYRNLLSGRTVYVSKNGKKRPVYGFS